MHVIQPISLCKLRLTASSKADIIYSRLHSKVYSHTIFTKIHNKIKRNPLMVIGFENWVGHYWATIIRLYFIS